MKRYRWCSVLIVLTTLILLIWNTSRSDHGKLVPHNPGIMRISVILPHSNDGYWSEIAEGMQSGQKTYSDNVSLKISIPQLNYNIEQMTELIRRQTAAKVDAIIVQGNDNPEYQKALEDAMDQRVQVILLDTDIEAFRPHMYIGTNNYEAGMMMGEMLYQTAGASSKVAVLSGEEGYSNMEERYMGLLESIKKYPGIQILRLEYDNYDGITAISKYNQIHEENPEIDTLVCLEGTGGQTIGSILDPKEKYYSHILAFDDVKETREGIKNGFLDGTMTQDTRQMGYKAIEEAYNRWKYGTYSYRNSCVYTPVYWMTAEDLQEDVADE